MNNWMKSSALLLAMGMLAGAATAQEKTIEKEKNTKKKKSETIVIRKKGEAKEKYTIVVDGDKVTINGKPVEDFKGEDLDVSVNENAFWFNEKPFKLATPLAPHGGLKMFGSDDLMGNKAFLGVVTDKVEDGAKITEVTKESAAEKAGLKEGDIITKIGDNKIDGPGELFEAIGKYKPEEKVTVTYKRDGKDNTATAILGKSKNRVKNFHFEGDDFAFAPPAMDMNHFWSRKPRLGVQIQDTEDGKGVKILDVDEETPAAKAGLKEDDVITDINGKAIGSVDELKASMKELKEGDVFKIGYKRNNQAQVVEVKIPKKLKTTDL
ncbi:PDZ domain-containing protein [Foetidibacter luteolus]|uniref:PDZ domain-containing protein n=1 Tax=Foetidibacter luteolus TaxID=2608880 RepID=UPI00129A24C2|nr:PDZ domain-containing protein [Foetidibacter luteolus]